MGEFPDYELIDFGAGRKLERFGAWVLDRPAPAAEQERRRRPASDWDAADARYERASTENGTWRTRAGFPETWSIRRGPITLELKLTPAGHLGLFPEHVANWDRVAAWNSHAGRPLKILNLFAYTGGTTLAAAATGAEVTHVDAARNIVSWSRHNAQLSGLGSAPIRWIVEDALTFARRELRRGRNYDALVLDPPSYGHGPRGESWSIARDLPELLDVCSQLTAERCEFLLITCHTPGLGPRELATLARRTKFRELPLTWQSGELTLTSQDGRALACGSSLVLTRSGPPPGRQ